MKTSTLGESWHGAVGNTSDAGYANADAIDRAARQRDSEANHALATLKSDTIPAGITSCMGRNSPSLTIPLPAALAGCHNRLSELADWLQAERLASVIVDMDDGKLGLSITPR